MGKNIINGLVEIYHGKILFSLDSNDSHDVSAK
jgi:hypothetical protein